MYMYYNKGDFEMMQKYHITDCFECGSCAFNCPARMPLTHAFKTAKLIFQAKAAKEKAAAEAKMCIRDSCSRLCTPSRWTRCIRRI